LARVLEFIENVLAQLESADWAAAAVAVAVHVANVAVRAHAWRNIIAAAYPADRVGRRRIFSAYAAGAGVNALSPWRGGELLRLSLARRAVAGSTYPGLVSTLGVETVFNSLAAGSLFGFAVAQGAFPNPDLRVAVALLAAGITSVATPHFTLDLSILHEVVPVPPSSDGRDSAHRRAYGLLILEPRGRFPYLPPGA
jgi:hypothetical protein